MCICMYVIHSQKSVATSFRGKLFDGIIIAGQCCPCAYSRKWSLGCRLDGYWHTVPRP